MPSALEPHALGESSWVWKKCDGLEFWREKSNDQQPMTVILAPEVQSFIIFHDLCGRKTKNHQSFAATKPLINNVMGRKAILQAGIHVRLKAKNYAHIVTGQDADGKDVKVKINAEARGKILETVGKNLYKVEFFAGEKGIVVGTKVPSAQITIDREAHPEHAVSGPARSTTGPNTTSSAGLRASPSTSSNQRSGFTKPKEPSKKKKKPAIVYPTALEWIQTFEEDPSKIHKNGYILKDENEANADTSQNQAAVANDDESPSSTGGENSGGNITADANAQDEANIVSGNEAGNKAGNEAGDGEGFDVNAKDLEEDNLPALADLADEILLEEAKRGKDFEMKKFRSWSQIEKLVKLGYEVECKDGRK